MISKDGVFDTYGRATIKIAGYDSSTILCLLVQAENMRLLEGARVPSLWLPRFDVYISENQMQHCGLESVYSILNEQAVRPLLHGDDSQGLFKK
ncbi:hypothetical protein [Moritella sp. JT01]|uniref:hypothetical protein n=1 Tax=Moritella sp. JT01 TaxID=756698 RepID=UPI000B016908|nr:hypothetical protein [Moritella sp. JT01]